MKILIELGFFFTLTQVFVWFATTGGLELAFEFISKLGARGILRGGAVGILSGGAIGIPRGGAFGMLKGGALGINKGGAYGIEDYQWLLVELDDYYSIFDQKRQTHSKISGASSSSDKSFLEIPARSKIVSHSSGRLDKSTQFVFISNCKDISCLTCIGFEISTSWRLSLLFLVKKPNSFLAPDLIPNNPPLFYFFF